MPIVKYIKFAFIFSGVALIAFYFWLLYSQDQAMADSAIASHRPSDAAYAEFISTDLNKSLLGNEVTYQENPRVTDRTIPLNQKLDNLLNQSKLDASTAYDLANELMGCISRLEPEYIEYLLLQDNDKSLDQAETLLEHEHYCSGINSQYSRTAYELLDSAAARGLINAQLSFNYKGEQYVFENRKSIDEELLSSFRSKTFTYLNIALLKGEPTAALMISDIFQQNTLLPRNPQQAYRFYQEHIRLKGYVNEFDRKQLRRLRAQF